MIQTKILSIKKEKVLALVQFSFLVGAAALAPLIKQQAITGSMVNAILFVSTALLGVQAGVLVGLIPSLIAFSAGLLPAVLAPIIPFIMTANTILVVAFNYLKEKNYWLAVVSASFLKFIFLFSTSSIAVNFILKKEIALKAAMMMGWPQLLTALAGGIIAFLFLKSIKKIKK